MPKRTSGPERPHELIDHPRRRMLQALLAFPTAGIIGFGASTSIRSVLTAGGLDAVPLTPACDDGDDDPTPAQTEGPYFKPSSPERRSLLEPGMPGTPLTITGQVIASACTPIAGALLDFWQADDGGRYDNAGFRLRGHQYTDAEGRYRLRSVVPGFYPGRARPIHVKVQPRDGRVLTTQLYFPGESKNRSDGLFRKELLVRTAKNEERLAGRFDFVVG